MSTLREKVLAKLQKETEKLKDSQARRAKIIEKALKSYEKTLTVSTVREYIDLSEQQRKILGLNNEKSVISGNLTVTINHVHEDNP